MTGMFENPHSSLECKLIVKIEFAPDVAIIFNINLAVNEVL